VREWTAGLVAFERLAQSDARLVARELTTGRRAARNAGSAPQS
jgi:hypothetical protein